MAKNHDLDHLSAAEQIEHEQDYAEWNGGIDQAFEDRDDDRDDDWMYEPVDADRDPIDLYGADPDFDEYFGDF